MRRLLLVMVLFLAGCTTPVLRTDVTRFHTLDAAPAPTSFTIIPDPEQVGSLEFQDYAAKVADALAAKGWRPVAAGGGADAIVTVHWGVDSPVTVAWQSPAPMGWGPRPYWGDPFPAWETRTQTTYPRWLTVQITDAHASGRKVLFEGRAVADGNRREIAPAMPALVQALFTGFPGTSGSTVRITVPLDR